MNELELLIIACAKSYMHNSLLEQSIDFEQEKWQKVFKIAYEQRLLPVVYEMVCHEPSFLKNDDKIKKYWRQTCIMSIVDQVNKSKAYLSLYQKIEDNNLDCLVTKGLILRELYQKKEWRTSGDEDVLVSKKDFKLLHQILIENDYQVLNSDYIDDLEVVVYDNYRNGLHLEVHRVLFGNNTPYHYLNDFFKDAFKTKNKIDIDNNEIQVMNPQLQLLYLISHAFKHFVNIGVGLRQIMDIGMYSQKYYQVIDWNKLFEDVSKFNGVEFVCCIYMILNDYLNVSYEKINFPVEKIDMDIDYLPFLKDIFKGGIYGKATKNRTYSCLATRQLLDGKKKGLTFGIFFPTVDKLKQSYPILNKHPYLIFYVWIKRAIRFIKRYCNDHSRNNINIKEIIDGNNERINLLKKYNIIK